MSNFDIAKRIKEVSNLKGIKSDYELAKKSGIQQSTLHAINKGKTPNVSTLEKICNTLGITMAEFDGKIPEENLYESVKGDKELIEFLNENLNDPEFRVALSQIKVLPPESLHILVKAIKEVTKEKSFEKK